MELNFVRDHAMYVPIFGFFAMSWIGWAYENPPKSWRKWLIALSTFALVVFLFGCYLGFTHWGAASVFHTPGVPRQFGIIVGIESALAGIGVGILFGLKKRQFVASWIATIVGLHFLPLASLFKDDGLYILAVLMVTAAIVPHLVAKKMKVSAVTLIGISEGIILLLFALRGFLLTLW